MYTIIKFEPKPTSEPKAEFYTIIKCEPKTKLEPKAKCTPYSSETQVCAKHIFICTPRKGFRVQGLRFQALGIRVSGFRV